MKQFRLSPSLMAVLVAHLPWQAAQAVTGTWGGAGGATWDTTDTNWTGVTGTPWDAANGPGNTAIFTSAATPVISGAVHVNTITMDAATTLTGGTITLAGSNPTINGTGAGIITSVLAGSNGLTKSGSGSLAIDPGELGANTLSGDITIDGGSLTTYRSTALGDGAGAITVNAGATLSVDYNSITRTGLVTVDGTGAALATYNGLAGIINNGDGFLIKNGAAVTAILGGSAGLTVEGAGASILWSQATYTGATTIGSGQLMLAGSGGIPATSAVDIASGASINLTGYYAANNINRTIGGLTGGGILYGGGGTVTVNKTSGTDTFSGAVQGNHGLIKDGAGTLVLTGASNHTGGTTISAGTLEFNGGSVTGNITNNSSLVTYSDLANVVSGTGSLTKEGIGTAVLWNPNTYSGDTVVNNGQLMIGGGGAIPAASAVDIASGASINLTGYFAANNINRTIAGLTGGGILYGGGGTVTVNKVSGTDTFSGALTGAQGFIKDGAGTLELAGASSHSGGTTISAGTLRILEGGSLTGNITNNATLNFDGAHGVGNVISGTGSVVVSSTNSTVMYLWAQATYTGATVLGDNSRLALAGGGGLPADTAVEIGSGAILDLKGPSADSAANRTIAGLSGSGTVNGNGHTGTLTVNKTSSTDIFSGLLIGGTSLTKDGAGTLVLAGPNTYTGATTVNGGTLVVDGDSIADTGRIDINGSGKVEVTESVDPVIEIVDTLYINGIQKAIGTYGATGSGAANIDDTHFAGAGVVQVTNGPSLTGYALWADTNAPSGTPSDDYDGDGVNNALEWVLGGLAVTADLDKLPDVATTNGNMTFSFVRNDAAWAGGDTTVAIEVGTTLAAWPSSYNVPQTPGVYGPVTVTDNGSTDTVTLTVAQAPDAKKFARLKVVVTP